MKRGVEQVFYVGSVPRPSSLLPGLDVAAIDVQRRHGEKQVVRNCMIGGVMIVSPETPIRDVTS